jgi:hypothetical protein
MIDLYQIRRDLVAIRSSHSGNVAVTGRINKLLGKIAHVREAESPAHEAELKRLIAEATKTLAPKWSSGAGMSRGRRRHDAAGTAPKQETKDVCSRD